MNDAASASSVLAAFSPARSFAAPDWPTVPDEPGVYVIYDRDELLYVGMAGRDGKGSLRRRLKDHSTGQVVNMFAQYLFLARVQFTVGQPITHPRAAKSACHAYIAERCAFRFRAMASAGESRALEVSLRSLLRPVLNAEGVE